MSPGPDEGRWREALLECRPGAAVARSERFALVPVERGRALFADADALGAWRHDEVKAAWDGSAASATVAVGGAALCLFETSWGDGVFPAYRDLDDQGRLVQVRLDLGNEETVTRRRRVEAHGAGELARYAIVSARVLGDGEPVRWLYREPPDRDEDSGWRLFAGDEPEEYLDDAAHARAVPLRDLLPLDARLEGLFAAPVGSAFARDDDGPFTAVEGFRPEDETQPG
jgi:hypothetical protein